MSCSEIIPSNDVYDFIVSSDERNTPLIEPICVQSINRNYAILYYDKLHLIENAKHGLDSFSSGIIQEIINKVVL